MRVKKLSMAISIVILSVSLILLIAFNSALGNLIYTLIKIYEKVLILGYTFMIEVLRSNIQKIYPVLTVVSLIFSILFIQEKIENTIVSIKNKNHINSVIYSNLKGIIARTIKALTVQLFFLFSIVYSYGSASTGTKITALNGVANENAILAFFGGGAIASGGGGIALGYKVLILIFVFAFMWDFVLLKSKSFVQKLQIVKSSKKV